MEMEWFTQGREWWQILGALTVGAPVALAWDFGRRWRKRRRERRIVVGVDPAGDSIVVLDRDTRTVVAHYDRLHRPSGDEMYPQPR